TFGPWVGGIDANGRNEIDAAGHAQSRIGRCTGTNADYQSSGQRARRARIDPSDRTAAASRHRNPQRYPRPLRRLITSLTPDHRHRPPSRGAFDPEFAVGVMLFLPDRDLLLERIDGVLAGLKRRLPVRRG